MSWSSGPTVAASATPSPAFYTYQSPGVTSPAGSKVIALTFDDGPSPYTPQVLSVLERYRVPATFFEVGEEVEKYPQYTQQLAAAGFAVGNHTWTHADLAKIPVSQFPYQIDQTQFTISALTGQTPECVRPPYDSWNTTALQQIAGRGLTTMSYSIDPSDYKMPGVQAIVDRVVNAAFPGAVVGMHDGGGNRAETVAALPQIITELSAEGYSFVSVCGGRAPQGPQRSAVYGFGQSTPRAPSSILSKVPLVGMATDPSQSGYWLVAADGGVFSFGDAGFFGSTGGGSLNQPIVGMAATPAGHGYWLVAADGGVFSFGDAGFFGSTGGGSLNQPIVGMAATPAGHGYWLVAADGGVFSFGDAGFFGSTGGGSLNRPIAGMAATPDGHGYWLVAADGGVFSFGDAGFFGSTGSIRLDRPIAAMAATSSGTGYWLVASDGGVFAFGDAQFLGSRAGQQASDQFLAISPLPFGGGYLLAAQYPAALGTRSV